MKRFICTVCGYVYGETAGIPDIILINTREGTYQLKSTSEEFENPDLLATNSIHYYKKVTS